MPYESKPGTRKMGDNPLEKRSCYKMKGFSGFGNSPVPKMDPMYNGEPGMQKEDFNQLKRSPERFLNFNFGGSQDNSKVKEKTKVTGDKEFSLFPKRGCACGKMKCNC